LSAPRRLLLAGLVLLHRVNDFPTLTVQFFQSHCLGFWDEQEDPEQSECVKPGIKAD
jgi:hypothetical protein